MKDSSGTPGNAAASPKQAADHKPLFPFPHAWKVATGVATLMVVLALIGVGLSTTSHAAAPTYWVSLVPIFGLLCVATASVRAKHEGKAGRSHVLRQLFHWLGIGMALMLDFSVRGTGVETGTAAGLNALLLLAVGCFLAGVHLEWVFSIVGVLLGLTLIVITKADQYLWVIFVAVGLAVAAMIGLRWLLSRREAS